MKRCREWTICELSAEIIKELEELLLSGGSAFRPKRNGFFDLENYERTSLSNFIHNGKVVLLATWRKSAFWRWMLALRIGRKNSGSCVPALRASAENEWLALDDWLQAEGANRAEKPPRRGLN